MKLEIDGVDYTAWLDAEKPARVVRQLNRPAEMQCALTGAVDLIPVAGARVRLLSESGEAVFTGYLPSAAAREHLGWGPQGAVYRCPLHAIGDTWILDQTAMPRRPVFMMQTAGEIVREMTESLGTFDLTEVMEGDPITQFGASLQRWSESARAVAHQSRMAYRVLDGKVSLRPVGERAFAISESDEAFSPERLKLESTGQAIGSVTVLGKSEPDAYVRDYFLGDGYSLRSYLSGYPYGQSTSTILEQEYDTALDEKYWKANGAVSVNSGRLWMQGEGTVEFAELMQMGGALTFQHGDVQFQAASEGEIGTLRDGTVSVAGFRIGKAGAQSTISSVINGVIVGQAITTVAGHRYVLSTRFYATDTVREAERYHSSSAVRGGGERLADARVALEVHDIDPNQPQSQVAAATVLYDGVIAGFPALCRYVLLDGTDLHCSVAYTRVTRLPNVLVRSALPGEEYRTRLVGAMVDGAECRVSNGELQFFATSVPASNEKIVAEYRTGRKSFAQLGNDGRSAAVTMVSPAARTSEDCANAAQALLDDSATRAWAGEYETWSDFLPGGAEDLWPGDRIDIEVTSGECSTSVIVREVEVRVADPANDRSWYAIKFANEAAEPIAMETTPASASEVASATVRDPEQFVLENLPEAQVTEVTSTSVTIDMGAEPMAGGGFEVRRTDSGWDPLVDRNLVGRYQTRVVTLTRLSRVQTFCVRQYDGSSPVRYSRNATQLHVDYPL